MKNLASALFTTCALVAAPPSLKEKKPMNRETAAQIVAPFYDALTTPATKNVRALAEGVLAPEWRSFAGEGISKGREEFIQLVMGFGKLIPDLKWDMKEVLVDGDRIIVRSQASGTPAGDFFGVPHTGKSFTIMTIDIHTVKDGKFITAHHVEDWTSALQQLR